MANCPVCQAPVPDDFGLIECAQCGAPLLVHMDGRVEHSGESEPPEVPPIAAAPEPEFDLIDPPEPPSFIELEAVAEVQPELEPEPESEPESLLEPELQPELEPEPETAAAPEPGPDELFAEPAKEAIVEASPAGVDAASPDLSDIARFGNSDVAHSRDGSLRYRIQVRGIDTADVREAFREAITDRKMMWDTDQILRAIKNGEVELPGLSPVKAYILVARLRDLPVQIRWEQYAVTQT